MQLLTLVVYSVYVLPNLKLDTSCFLVFSAWVTKHMKARKQIDVKPSRVFRPKASLHNLSRRKSVRLELTTTKKNCRCNRLRVKKKARGSGRYLIIASNVGGIMKVKAMKRMEDRQEIARMVRRC